MLITRTSPNSGKTVTLDVPCTPQQLALWESGLLLIQDAMPQVPGPLREFIKSGVTPEEWDEMLEASEDDEDRDESGACPECERSNGPNYRGPCEHGDFAPG